MLQADIEAHTCPKCNKPGNWRKYNGLHVVKHVPAYGYYNGSARLVLTLILIVFTGCLWALIIERKIRG